MSSPPSITETPQSPPKTSASLINTPNPLDTNAQASYTGHSNTDTLQAMSVSYLQAQKKNVRVTLDLSVYSDFDARQIDWSKLFGLDGDETVEAYVEDLDVEW